VKGILSFFFFCCLDGSDTVHFGRRAPKRLITFPDNTMKVEMAEGSETSVNFYQTSRHQIPETNLEAHYFCK
jgi:hypothetical protein